MMEKILQLMEQIVARDRELLEAVLKMKPEDQRTFLPRVEKSAEKTDSILQSLKN